MKTFITTLSIVLTTLSAIAQAQFRVELSGANEVPPNSSPNSGSGQFILSGSLLSWSIGCTDLSFTPTGADVYGPATSSQTGPAIFSLGMPTVGPGPQGGTLTLYSGSTSITTPQISELQASLWYVNVLSDQFPAGEIRGQIVPVPEPSILGLFGIAGVFLLVAARRRTIGAAILMASTCLSLSVNVGQAQEAIDSMSTIGPVTVVPGGTPTGQFVAPWVDVPPTMPYVDGVPVIQETPRPPLPGANATPVSNQSRAKLQKPQRHRSGIVGQTLIGPVCPVVRPGEDCADVPYQTTITVLSRHGKVLAQVETDDEGLFEILLPPGVYVLVPALPEVETPNLGDPSLGDVYPYAAPLMVTVKAKRLSLLIINYDSGIR